MNRIQLAITGTAAAALAVAVGFGVSHTQKIAEERRIENLSLAKKCLASIDDCTNNIDVKALPEDMKKDVYSALADAKIRRELVSNAKRCVAFKSLDSCEGLNSTLLKEVDPELQKKYNDALWSAKRAAIEEEKKEKARLARIKREEEEFKRLKWWEASNGIYARYCTSGPKPCSSSGVIGDASYVLVEIWCKERACGDIYGRVNLLNNSGTVVGWTNDTGYGGFGQKVVLTFDTYREGWSKAQITDLSFR